jgi:hypothetical protein
MGLDVYVGSLTRYYAGDWETVIQKYGREQGFEVSMVRPPNAPDAITDPIDIRAMVVAWREMLGDSLSDHINSPLDWNESNESPYFTDKPAWDCYTSLILWAAYTEHPDLDRPTNYIDDFATDEAYRRSADADSPSAFSQLLNDVEIWLPNNFDFTFRTTDATGREVGFGSSVALMRQLDELNRHTWDVDADTLASWRRAGCEHQAELELGARFAFAIMRALVRESVEHQLVMKLDY